MNRKSSKLLSRYASQVGEQLKSLKKQYKQMSWQDKTRMNKKMEEALG